jgi:hypothetical protein
LTPGIGQVGYHFMSFVRRSFVGTVVLAVITSSFFVIAGVTPASATGGV